MRHPTSQRLRIARQRRYDSAAAAARAAGIKVERYQKWENDGTGNGVPYDGAVLMAPLLGVSPEWIMRGVGLGPEGGAIPDPSNDAPLPRAYLILAADVLEIVLRRSRISMNRRDQISAVIRIATFLMTDGIDPAEPVEAVASLITKGMLEGFLKEPAFNR